MHVRAGEVACAQTGLVQADRLYTAKKQLVEAMGFSTVQVGERWNPHNLAWPDTSLCTVSGMHCMRQPQSRQMKLPACAGSGAACGVVLPGSTCQQSCFVLPHAACAGGGGGGGG
jgi:hypothetical protein